MYSFGRAQLNCRDHEYDKGIHGYDYLRGMGKYGGIVSQEHGLEF